MWRSWSCALWSGLGGPRKPPWHSFGAAIPGDGSDHTLRVCGSTRGTRHWGRGIWALRRVTRLFVGLIAIPLFTAITSLGLALIHGTASERTVGSILVQWKSTTPPLQGPKVFRGCRGLGLHLGTPHGGWTEDACSNITSPCLSSHPCKAGIQNCDDLIDSCNTCLPMPP